MRGGRQLGFALAVWLWLGACGGGDSKEPRPARPGPGVEAPYASAPANPQTGVAALEGTWSATAYVDGYGTTTAVVTLSREGDGHYLVSLPELSRDGQFRVSYWDGRWLQAEGEGHEERVRGTLSGDRLRLELPYVGTISFQREAK